MIGLMELVERVERRQGQCARMYEENWPVYQCRNQATVGSIELNADFCPQCYYEVS